MIPEGRSGLLERLEPALLAAAVTPGLRSILLFSADRLTLDAVTHALEQMLSLTTGRDVVRRYLGSSQQEDDLWIRPDLSSEDGRLSVRLRPGTLAMGLDETRMPLLVIPDLAELSLAAARGGVALMGASVAHLERYGASRQWFPDACWLAACDRTAIGKVSPHLLDRFALRLDAEPSPSPSERIADLRRSVLEEQVRGHPLSRQATDRLTAAVALQPTVLPGTLDRIVSIEASAASARREIALARLAVACARLEGSDSVGQQHVDQAAQLLGLRLPTTVPGPAIPKVTGPSDTNAQDDVRPSATGDNLASGVGEGARDAAGRSGQAVMAADAPEALLPVDLPGELAGPYPEDQAIAERDLTALREVATRSQSSTVPRGSIVGVQQARGVSDLALLNTVLTAATWAPYRRIHAVDWPDDGSIRLLPSDLRSYRRAPAPEQLLALVIDYTCLEGWDWAAALLPYLRRAYVDRAGIVLVRVGAKHSADQERADRLVARNLLDPRLDAALYAGPGRATPLAHGLFLALQALKHGLQHGEGNVRRARLVVVTDGRGNVPLDVDRDLNTAGAVGRAGVESALRVAASIRAIAAIETILIDPEPDIYPELVPELARALGAEPVPGRTRESAVKTTAMP